MKEQRKLVPFLLSLKESENKFVLCINANSPKMDDINSDTTDSEINKLILFNCSVENILSNKKACDVLKEVEIFDKPQEEDNTIYILGNYANHTKLKLQLKKVGIC